MASSNELRMPFAEWLFRMSEARVPPAARELAIYAVAFKVSSNEELAKLAGMDTKGIADKTYNGWKKRLLADGWVILKAITIGRATTIEVFPAFEASPVTFTDLKGRDSRRFYESKSYERTVEVTDVEAGSPVEVTDEARNSYDPAVEVTAVSRAPIRARLETPSGLLKPKKLEEKSPFYPQSDGERVTFENGRLELKNGLRQFWLEQFGDEQLLNLAVIQAAGYVQPNSMKPLEAQVSAQLARKVADMREKDARYAKAVKDNGKAPRQPAEDRAALLKAQNEKLRKEYGFDKETQ
jgi:hypothetical protein